jgi:hypothetical protein
MDVFDGLKLTLEQVAINLNELGVEWMLIGGSAMAMHGLGDGPISDIDIVVSSDGAKCLTECYKWPNLADTGSVLFKSDYFFKYNSGEIPIEIMGNFQIWNQNNWIEIAPSPTITMPFGQSFVKVATLARLSQIFRLTGRDKDIRRAELIASHPNPSGKSR